MYTKQLSFARFTANWTLTIALLAMLLFSTVTPAYAGGNPIQSIIAGSQNGVLTHGAAGSATFLITVTFRTKASNVNLLVSGFDPSVTYDFNPPTLSYGGTSGESKIKTSTLTVHTKTATPAGSRTLTVTAKYSKWSKSATTPMTVSAPSLTITANNQVKTYGDVVTFAGTEFSVTGLIAPDTVTSATISSTGSAASAAVSGSPYPIVISNAVGSGLSNYFPINYVNGNLTVNKAMLTVTATSSSYFMLNTDPYPTIGYLIGGYVNGEGPSAIGTLPNCSAPNPLVLGDNLVTCSGASASNYNFSYVDAHIFLADANNPPTAAYLDGSSTGVSIPEFQPADTLIGMLTADDVDQAHGDVVTFSLPDPSSDPSCADNASFQISGAHSDELHSANSPEFAFDYETKPSLSICVKAQDSHGATFTQPLTITILNRIGVLTRFVSSGAYDGFVSELGKFNAAGTTTNVGDDANGKKSCTILSFNTAVLPDTSGLTITSATLNIRLSKAVGSPFTSGLGSHMTVEMKQPFLGSKLGLEAADYGDSSAVLVGTMTPPASPTNMVYTADLDPKLFAANTNAEPTQLRLCFPGSDSNNAADYLKFWSGNASSAAYRPVLKMEYSLPQVTVILKSNPTQDGQVTESASNSNAGGAINASGGTMLVGDNAKNQELKSVLSFNTAVLPDNAVVTGVQLKIMRPAIINDPFGQMGNLFVDLKQPFFGGGPALQAADFQDLADQNAVGTVTSSDPLVGNWYTINLDPLKFSSLTPKVLTQLRLNFASESGGNSIADALKFYSGNAISANRPQLVITFAIP